MVHISFERVRFIENDSEISTKRFDFNATQDNTKVRFWIV